MTVVRAVKPDSWMPLYIAKYGLDTTHLNAEQHGAYLLLLMYGWTHGGLIPLSEKSRFQITRMTAKQWRESKGIVMAFFQCTDNGYTQKRQLAEIEKATGLVAAKSAAGKNGAAKRWQNDGKANGKRMAEPLAEGMAEGMANRCQDDAPLPITTDRKSKALTPMVATQPVGLAPDDAERPAEKVNGSESKTIRTQQLTANAREILTFLNTRAGKKFPFSDSNVGIVVARLKEGFTPTQVRQVVAMKVRKWKADENMAEYLRPETLFGRKKFSNYVGELVDVPDEETDAA